MARTGGIRYAVFTWVPEALLPEWNDWHNRVHIPNVLAAPQMRGVRKYRVADGAFPGDWTPQYVTVYQLDSLEDFEAYRRTHGIARRRDYDDRYGDVGKVARVVLGEEVQLGERDAPPL